MILFHSILCTLAAELPAFFWEVMFMVLLDKLEGSECDVELIP